MKKSKITFIPHNDKEHGDNKKPNPGILLEIQFKKIPSNKKNIPVFNYKINTEIRKAFYEKKINNIKKSYGNIRTGNKNEQSLFKLVFAEEKKDRDLRKKFECYLTFKSLNDRYMLIDPNSIIEKKFTSAKDNPLYNRYNQFRQKEYKKLIDQKKK